MPWETRPMKTLSSHLSIVPKMCTQKLEEGALRMFFLKSRFFLQMNLYNLSCETFFFQHQVSQRPLPHQLLQRASSVQMVLVLTWKRGVISSIMTALTTQMRHLADILVTSQIICVAGLIPRLTTSIGEGIEAVLEALIQALVKTLIIAPLVSWVDLGSQSEF